MSSPIEPTVTTEDADRPFIDIGVKLREARLAKGEDLPKIANFLRIRLNVLEAIEAGDREQLA
ncbi:MAG: helix-turn-helix domain-containing protein, partial [Alphaproteobacteria bacterium]|nr:helix-turn-helix domain-containing protein [Alphaproteobacteria bacterium]